MFKKLINEIHALTWTLGGTGMVLITLSGDTRKYGIWITFASIAIHLFGILIKKEES